MRQALASSVLSRLSGLSWIDLRRERTLPGPSVPGGTATHGGEGIRLTSLCERWFTGRVDLIQGSEVVLKTVAYEDGVFVYELGQVTLYFPQRLEVAAVVFVLDTGEPGVVIYDFGFRSNQGLVL
ncbi:hypothetical protein J6590_067335 [Homalodisca vitripennis]|nr:hypothetical protein J6590_067335 [Homalodisca vitripennis]